MTLNTLENLARLEDDRGQLEEAARLMRAVLEIGTRIDGPDHPDTAINAGSLGGLLVRLNRLEEAQELLDASLPRLAASIGQMRLEYWIVRGMAANLLGAKGRHDESLAEHRACLDWCEHQLPARWMELAPLRQHVATELLALGRDDEAESMVRSAVEIITPQVLPDSLFLANARIELGRVLNRTGKYADSHELLTQALGVYDKTPGIEVERMARLKAALASSQVGLGRLDLAEQLLLSAVASLQEQRSPRHDAVCRELSAQLTALATRSDRPSGAARVAPPADPLPAPWR